MVEQSFLNNTLALQHETRWLCFYTWVPGLMAEVDGHWLQLDYGREYEALYLRPYYRAHALPPPNPYLSGLMDL